MPVALFCSITLASRGSLLLYQKHTEEIVPPELEQLVAALQDLVDAAGIINKTPDDVLEGLQPAHLDTVAGLVTRAFESLNGYENRKRQWVTGALDRLEQLYVRLLPDEGAGL